MKELFNNLRFTWKYSKYEKKYFIISFLSHIIGIGVSILIPIVSAKIIIALSVSDFEKILYIACILFGIQILEGFFNYLNRIASTKIYRNTLSRLEIDLGREVLKLENKSLDNNGSGLFIQRMTNDTSRLAEIFNGLFETLSAIIQYFGYFIAIFITNKLIFIYCITMTIVLFIVERIRTNRKNENDKIQRKASEKVSSFISELVRGARDIKMLNSENDFIKELSTSIDDANNKRYIMQKTNFNFQLLSRYTITLFDFILILLIMLLLKNHIIEATIALVLYNYAERLEYSSWVGGNFLEMIKDFNLSSERVNALLQNTEFKKEKFGTKHINNINGNFEFKNVYFAYGQNKVLKDLSFKIKSNETVAFVGKSGAGKTTIFNLLCKMYEPQKGTITIDGIDINELDKDSIRGNITIISQNPYIFNLSIKDNLKLVKSDLTDKEMKEACKAACLDEFIKTLPDKYDTVVGEGGITLSGGQKQRLAIARALVQKTKIILFDEATSALDNETQSEIQKAIESMRNDYTILIIAHRLSTIINADRILFIDQGKIIAEGSHKQLLKNCPEYKELYNTEIKKQS